jgi:hypothetical protein
MRTPRQADENPLQKIADHRPQPIGWRLPHVAVADDARQRRQALHEVANVGADGADVVEPRERSIHRRWQFGKNRLVK